MAVEFEEQGVGKGGAGFVWPSPTDRQEQRLHSLSLPPHPPPCNWESDSDEGSIVYLEQDQMETVVQDPEVLLILPLDAILCYAVMFCADSSTDSLGHHHTGHFT